MEWKFTGDKPVYQQIVERLSGAILTGKYPAGQRIPSVRELAAQARVNPNTMQRALQEMEERRLLITMGTTGRCVTEDQQVLEDLRCRAVDQAIQLCAEQLRILGVSAEQAAQRMLELEKGEQKYGCCITDD